MGWGVPVLVRSLSMCDRCCWVCEILGFWLEWLFYGVCGLHLGDSYSLLRLPLRGCPLRKRKGFLLGGSSFVYLMCLVGMTRMLTSVQLHCCGRLSGRKAGGIIVQLEWPTHLFQLPPFLPLFQSFPLPLFSPSPLPLP